MPGEFRRRELIDGHFIVTHVIDDSHDGCRMDQFLRDQYHYLSRNKLQLAIREGRISLARSQPGATEGRLKAATTLWAGDLVRVSTAYTAEPEVDLNYGILFEDEDILVVDKPGNLPVHPAGKFLFHTLLMQLRKERPEWLAKGHDFFLTHRLDRETSGVLLMAKTSEMAGRLVRQFRERETEKRYFAVAHGSPNDDAFDVDADIGSAADSAVRLKMEAFPKGTSQWTALTRFRVAKRGMRYSLLDCKLETGRQHQIRVHLAHAGFPVVGDKLYGPMGEQVFLDHLESRRTKRERLLASTEWDPIGRHALHSRYLRFQHPRSDEWIEAESPLPRDMKGLV